MPLLFNMLSRLVITFLPKSKHLLISISIFPGGLVVGILGFHFHDPGNHDGVITHLEPDILECEAKWALGRITMNQANGSDGIPIELFRTLKDDAVNVLHSICQQIWKTHHWPQDWKGSVFIPILKKGNAKEC